MKRMILIVLVAIVLAWNFANPLIDALTDSLPTTFVIVSFLKPANLLGQGVTFYFKFLLAVIVWALFIKFVLVLSGFIVPQTGIYSATKPVRRIQGVWFELMVIGFFFLVVPLVYLSLAGWPTPATQRTAELSSYEMVVSAAEDYLSNETSSADRATIYVETIKANWLGWLVLAVGLWAVTTKYIKRLFVPIHAAVLLGFIEKGRFGLGGSARFAGLIEEWGLRYKRTGLFMGRSLYSRGLHIAADDERMMFTFAGARGGKGTTSIIPNMLLWEGSAVVIDPKGTIALVTARRRREMGQEVVVFDPFHVLEKALRKQNKTYKEVFGKNRPDSFNPFAGLNLNSEVIREDIAIIADALVVPDPVQKEFHWDDGSKTGIGALMAQLLSDSRYSNPSLPMIRDLLALPTRGFAELLDDMSNNRRAGDLTRDAATRFIRGIDTDEIRNILSNMDKHTEWLSSPAMKRVLSQPTPTFRFSSLKQKPTTVFLVIPPQYLDVHKRFLRLFINLTLREIAKGGRSKIPILMLLDEFQQLGKMPEMVKAYRLLAGYNACVWCFAQDWPGMVELYGASDAKSFISNSRAVQVFSETDPDSLELISKHIGTRMSKQATAMGFPHLRTTDEVSKEIARDTGQQYILRDKAPLILERVEYFEDKKTSLLANLLQDQDRYSKPEASKPSWTSTPLRALKLWLRARYFPFAGLYDPDPDYVATFEPDEEGPTIFEQRQEEKSKSDVFSGRTDLVFPDLEG